MLGKLFKYEFKNTSKIMLTIYAVLIAVTALGMGVMSFDAFQQNNNPVVSIITCLYLLVYVLSIFALLIVTYVYLSIHFYKTMYSTQGYLTHTLPVKPVSTLHVKLLTALVWMLLSMFIMFLSVMGLVFATAGPDIFKELRSYNFSELNDALVYNFGLNIVELFFAALIGVISSCLIFLLMVYLSCSIGQLFNQHKVAASIVAGIVLYFLQQMISSAIMLIQLVNSSLITTSVLESDSAIANYYSSSLWSGIIMNLAFVAIYYIACRIILKKHINLE